MRILVAEDDRVTRRLLESYIGKWGHETIVCSAGTDAWQVLSSEDRPRVAVIDWMMPEMTGVEVCKRVREEGGQPYVYIILLTSKGGKEDVVQGLDAGADDYIVKPFNPNELRVRVRAGTRIIQLQEDLQAALETSEFRASHDLLTGLSNRAAVMEALKGELARSARQHTPTGIIIADVDHFKRVNDQHGHLAGDAVLREVALRLRSSVRPYDSVGRYGGEEFLIVLPGCTSEVAAQTAERVRSEFNEHPLVTPEGSFNITLSFGVSSCPGGIACDADNVIREADQALYQAKDGGRNRVETFANIDAGIDLSLSAGPNK
jgi:two-component system, cell cycle response regulator